MSQSKGMVIFKILVTYCAIVIQKGVRHYITVSDI